MDKRNATNPVRVVFTLFGALKSVSVVVVGLTGESGIVAPEVLVSVVESVVSFAGHAFPVKLDGFVSAVLTPEETVGRVGAVVSGLAAQETIRVVFLMRVRGSEHGTECRIALVVI